MKTYKLRLRDHETYRIKICRTYTPSWDGVWRVFHGRIKPVDKRVSYPVRIYK